MKHLKLIGLSVLAVSATLLYSCKKTDIGTPVGDTGKTFVKIVGGDNHPAGTRTLGLDFRSTAVPVDMIDIRRAATTNAELNKKMTIIVQDDPGLVTTLDPSLEPLPAISYTLAAPTTKVGDKYTVVMNPGEFAKQITFNIITNYFDPSKRYGMGFSIYSVDAGGAIADTMRKYVVVLGAKNNWDGVYNVKGKFYLHPTYGAFPGYEYEVELQTAGTSTVNQYSPDFGEFCQPFTVDAAGSLNRFGGIAPQYTVDPATNLVTLDPNGGPGNTTPQTTPAGANNRYDPATKTFYVQHGYLNAAGALRYWADTLTYVRAR